MRRVFLGGLFECDSVAVLYWIGVDLGGPRAGWRWHVCRRQRASNAGPWSWHVCAIRPLASPELLQCEVGRRKGTVLVGGNDNIVQGKARVIGWGVVECSHGC